MDALTSGRLTDHLQLLVASAAGGKVLRGTLVMLGYELSGASPNPAILTPAVAYEILNTALLIHDDAIDKGLMRRGQPTPFKSLGQNHYGLSQSICLGDSGFFLASKLLAEADFAPELRTTALGQLSHVIINTAAGQMLDVKLASIRQPPPLDDVLNIQKLKSASYSVVGPLQIGAIFGGAGLELLAAIERFGLPAGLAFQIQDDILGTFGEPMKLGKSVTSDIEENKPTLLLSYALTHASKADLKVLKKSYGSGKINSGQHKLIKQVFINSGALDYARAQAEHYSAQSKLAIFELTSDLRLQTLLAEFADFSINRQK